MTQRILMITEKPNKKADQLPCREDLFDLEKNPFSQFFGRILFGSEKCFRAYFNDKLVMWKHARKSYLQDDCGRICIQNYIKNHANKIELIVTFGIPAARKILSNKNANIERMSDIFEDGLQPLCDVYCNKSLFNTVTIPVAALPHTSGEAQQFWKNYPCVWSKLVEEIQEKACKICRDSNNCCCSSCK
jgi:hypothetical protein